MALVVMNASELRNAYEILRILSEEKTVTESRKEYIDSIKRSIRRSPYLLSKKTTKIVRDFGIDGYTELIELPDFIKSMEEASDYFFDRHYMPPISSIYDCTGVRFTLSYKIFERRNNYYVFHDVRADV